MHCGSRCALHVPFSELQQLQTHFPPTFERSRVCCSHPAGAPLSPLTSPSELTHCRATEFVSDDDSDNLGQTPLKLKTWLRAASWFLWRVSKQTTTRQRQQKKKKSRENVRKLIGNLSFETLLSCPTFSSPLATRKASSTTLPAAMRAAVDVCDSFQVVSLSTCGENEEGRRGSG